MILSPDAPAGRVVDSPVSLRDLPATVVDLLGLSAGSPFPGRSLAAYWGRRPGKSPPEITTPAFSEQADATAFQPQPGSGRGQAGSRCPWWPRAIITSATAWGPSSSTI